MSDKKTLIIGVAALAVVGGLVYFLFIRKSTAPPGSGGSGSGGGSTSTGAASASVSLTSMTDNYERDVAFFNGSPGTYLGGGKWSGNMIGEGKLYSGQTTTVALSSVPSSGLYVAISDTQSSDWSGDITINGQVFGVAGLGIHGVDLN